jgi:hypothetical protein
MPLPSTPSKQPIFKHQPPPGTVLEDLWIVCDPPGSQEMGININGSSNLTVRNCRIEGFQKNFGFTGGHDGLTCTGNTSLNATGTWATMSGGGHCHGLFAEGLRNSIVRGNLIAGCGWWVGYNPADDTQRTLANLNHGMYLHQNYADDSNVIADNIVIDTAGSQILARAGGKITGNVTRAGGDWDIIVAETAKSASVLDNAHFGPRTDGLPYYGGGIRLMIPGVPCLLNIFAGSARITNNPAAIDVTGNVVPGQLGLWTKPGASRVVAPGTPTLTLEAIYGTSSQAELYAAIKPADAPRLVRIMQAWQGIVPPPQVILQPAPVPAPVSATVTFDFGTGKLTLK